MGLLTFNPARAVQFPATKGGSAYTEPHTVYLRRLN